MYDDDDILDRCCSCFLGCAPCSYCTDTYECEDCGTRVIADDQYDAAVNNMLCDDCFSGEVGPEVDSDYLMATIRAASGG